MFSTADCTTREFLSTPQVCLGTSITSIAYDAYVAVNIMLADGESTEKRYATWMDGKKKTASD